MLARSASGNQQQWPRTKGTMVRILKRSTIPDAEDQVQAENSVFQPLEMDAVNKPVANYLEPNRWLRSNLLFRSSRSKEIPYFKRNGLFLRTSKRNGLFLRTSKRNQGQDEPLESSALFLRSF